MASGRCRPTARVRFVAEGELTGVMRLLRPVVERLMARQFVVYHRNLRRNVEGLQA